MSGVPLCGWGGVQWWTAEAEADSFCGHNSTGIWFRPNFVGPLKGTDRQFCGPVFRRRFLTSWIS